MPRAFGKKSQFSLIDNNNKKSNDKYLGIILINTVDKIILPVKN